ncbi:capsular polysaccharide export protein, LipB/KpsS family [Acinetobacter baumannii]
MCTKFYFEYPVDWLKDNKVQQVTFIQNIIKGCLELEVELVCIPTSFPSYGVKRLSSKNLLISFHSFDNPHNVLSYKEAPINGLFSLDKTGYAGWSDISLNLVHYKQSIENIEKVEIEQTLSYFKKQLIEGNSKHPQLNENKKLPNNYILFPLQVRTDSVAAHANLDMVEVLKKISYFSKKYKKNLVVKVHPYCNSEVIKAIQFIETEENPYLYTSNAHIIKLIKNADKILSCNSGASLEALILGKDVSCFGKSEWYEITNKIESYSDLEEIFTSPPKLELTSFQKKYLTYLLKYYWVKFDDISTIKTILAKHISSHTIKDDSPNDLYSEFTKNLLNKQIELTNSQNKIELIEKDFLFMQEILNYFRRRPWKILKY